MMQSPIWWTPNFIGFLRPDADVETTNWSSTPLWQKVDESSADDDTTNIESDGITAEDPSTDSYDFEVGLSNPSSTPNGNETITVRVRYRLRVNSGTPLTTDWSLELKQSTTLIASDSWSDASESYVTREYTLTRAEARSITDHTALRVYVSYDGSNDGPGDDHYARVTWIEVEYS